MELTYDTDATRWVFKGTYADKEVPKAARFRWDPATKTWWTDDVERAARLKEIADQEAAEQIARLLAEIDAAREASRATDAALDLPAPEGLSYMPFQRAGIATVHRAEKGRHVNDRNRYRLERFIEKMEVQP